MQPDINFRAALALAGWRPTHPLEKAAEYFEFDFEFGGEPEDTSLQSNADVRADTDSNCFDKLNLYMYETYETIIHAVFI